MEEITQEEKNKILDALEKIKKQFGAQSSVDNLSEELLKDNKKLIECKHEIIIAVTASIFEENDEGNTIGAKEICKKNYHIPVPSDRDYQDYLSGFFNFLEQCMSSSVDRVEQQEEKNG